MPLSSLNISTSSVSFQVAMSSNCLCQQTIPAIACVMFFLLLLLGLFPLHCLPDCPFHLLFPSTYSMSELFLRSSIFPTATVLLSPFPRRQSTKISIDSIFSSFFAILSLVSSSSPPARPSFHFVQLINIPPQHIRPCFVSVYVAVFLCDNSLCDSLSANRYIFIC
eukprot:m.9605 g.9605  ORF g.9605 m.9605 type:complete len:166 (+) comp5778_c0_seq1:355-852(+)